MPSRSCWAAGTADGPSHSYEIGQPGDELGAWSIATGDVTGDGKPDVATGNIGAKSVSVLVNSGHGTLEPPVNYSIDPRALGHCDRGPERRREAGHRDRESEHGLRALELG